MSGISSGYNLKHLLQRTVVSLPKIGLPLPNLWLCQPNTRLRTPDPGFSFPWSGLDLCLHHRGFPLSDTLCCLPDLWLPLQFQNFLFTSSPPVHFSLLHPLSVQFKHLVLFFFLPSFHLPLKHYSFSVQPEASFLPICTSSCLRVSEDQDY